MAERLPYFDGFHANFEKNDKCHAKNVKVVTKYSCFPVQLLLNS